MLTWLKTIGHFFSSLFGASGNVVQTILHDISSFVNLAGPIVADLAALAKAQPDQTGLIANIERWIATYQTDAAKVAAWVGEAQKLPISDILRTAATLALSALVPAGTAQSMLNLAIELAYSVFKRQAVK